MNMLRGHVIPLGAWTTYTPTWISVEFRLLGSVGDGALTGRYKTIDTNTVAFRLDFRRSYWRRLLAWLRAVPLP